MVAYILTISMDGRLSFKSMREITDQNVQRRYNPNKNGNNHGILGSH